jgi:hypothetical protein
MPQSLFRFLLSMNMSLICKTRENLNKLQDGKNVFLGKDEKRMKVFDAPPSSLMDSIASPKVKIAEGERS